MSNYFDWKKQKLNEVPKAPEGHPVYFANIGKNLYTEEETTKIYRESHQWNYEHCFKSDYEKPKQDHIEINGEIIPITEAKYGLIKKKDVEIDL